MQHDADENCPLRMSSPYLGSKAGSALLALSYHATYKLPVTVTPASSNYRLYQSPEKLIPLMICNALAGEPLLVYGDGHQVRDWLYVDDRAQAIFTVLRSGRSGEAYDVSGNCSVPDLEVGRRLLKATARGEELIKWATDRSGHDRRYTLSSAKLETETGFVPATQFDERVQSGPDCEFYQSNHSARWSDATPELTAP